MKTMKKMVLLIIFNLAFIPAMMAGIVAIDFDGFAPSSPFTNGLEDGFAITGTGSGAFITQSGFGNPGLAAAHQLPGSDPTFTFTNGSQFIFVSLDLADLISSGVQPDVTVTGLLGGGIVATDVFSVAGGYITFSANNLLGVVIDRLQINLGLATTDTSPGPTGLDNVVLNDMVASSPVPEPSTYALFCLGVGAIGIYRRRNRKLKITN